MFTTEYSNFRTFTDINITKNEIIGSPMKADAYVDYYSLILIEKMKKKIHFGKIWTT